jgi:hypothetical protein
MAPPAATGPGAPPRETVLPVIPQVLPDNSLDG